MTFSHNKNNQCIEITLPKSNISFNPKYENVAEVDKNNMIVLTSDVSNIPDIEKFYEALGNRFIKNPGEYEISNIGIKGIWGDDSLIFYVRDDSIGILLLNVPPMDLAKIVDKIADVNVLCVHIDELNSDTADRIMNAIKTTECGLIIFKCENCDPSSLNKFKENFTDIQEADKYTVKKSDIEPTRVKMVVLE